MSHVNITYFCNLLVIHSSSCEIAKNSAGIGFAHFSGTLVTRAREHGVLMFSTFSCILSVVSLS